MSRRKTGRKLAPFIAMDRHQYKSAAFAHLSAHAQALLVHLTYNYNSKMMNAVWFSARDAARKLNMSKNTGARALLELEHYGFIVKVQGAYLGVKGVGKSAHYRLTALPYGNVGATREYEKWNGEIFDRDATNNRGFQKHVFYPVPQEGQCVPPEGHKEKSSTPPKMEQPSPRRDIRTAPDCPPGGTYLVLPAGSAAEAQDRQGGHDLKG
jgi:hypothetical protein